MLFLNTRNAEAKAVRGGGGRQPVCNTIQIKASAVPQRMRHVHTWPCAEVPAPFSKGLRTFDFETNAYGKWGQATFAT